MSKNIFLPRKIQIKNVEFIKLRDYKIRTIQIEDEWFVSVSVRHIGVALGASFDTLK